MNCITKLSFLLLIPTVCHAADLPRKLSMNEMVQPYKKGAIQPLALDLKNEDSQQIKSSRIKETLKEQGAFIIDKEDFPVCQSETALIQYYFSKDLSNATNISRIFQCNQNKYQVLLDVMVFKNPEYAKKGARLILGNAPSAFYEDQINRSFTGKQYGNFCVNTGEATILPGIMILFKNYFIKFYISHDRDNAPDPGLLDLWAETIVNKIKAGYGENVEPARP